VAVYLARFGAFCRERSNELGLRMALGAQPKQVHGFVLRQAILLSSIGVAIGLAGSFVATPYGVNPHDLLTTALVSSLFMGVTFCASYVPARHATRIDPVQTRRHE